MESFDRILLNRDNWNDLYRNLTAPTEDYAQAFDDYVARIEQSVEVEETGRRTVIRSDRIDFDGLLAILNGESIERRVIEDHVSVSAEVEWIKSDDRASFPSIATQKNTQYFCSADNYLAAA